MLANLFASAAALGLFARAVVGFIDDDVNGLLGIDPSGRARSSSSPSAVAARPAAPPPPVETIAPAVVPLSASEVGYPLLVDAYVNSSLDVGGRGARLARAGGGDGDRRPAARGIAHAAAAPADDARAARSPRPSRRAGRRASSRARRSRPRPCRVRSTTRAAASPRMCRRGLVDLYLAIHAVDGVAPGAYVYHPGPHALELIRRGRRASRCRLPLPRSGARRDVERHRLLPRGSRTPSRRARQPRAIARPTSRRASSAGGSISPPTPSASAPPASPSTTTRWSSSSRRTPGARPPSSSPPSAARRLLIKAHLLRWRPRQHAQRRATTPRVLPSGAASHLDLSEHACAQAADKGPSASLAPSAARST